jgi:catechol 2,3-dioxygenase-like lactoylglutathione lyase family enzyme
MTIKKLHHLAMRCSDAEQTRQFYEDFLGLPLVHTLLIDETKTGRTTNTLHIFFQLDDGSHLAFFEAPDLPFEFKQQHDFDLHTALEVDVDTMNIMLQKAKSLGIEIRGISDHEFIHSAYFRDPDGYIIELCIKQANHDQAVKRDNSEARKKLNSWQAHKMNASQL